jgi:hypothetical protein
LASQTFVSKRHDTGSRPVLDLTPPAGVTWTMQDAGVTAKFIARLPSGTTPKMDAPPVVTGPWQVRYDPTDTDVDTIGVYDCEVEVTPPDGKKVTFPTDDPADANAAGRLYWQINSDLDDA